MKSIESTFGIGRLIAKHLTDALNAGEQDQLDAWLKEDEKHRAIFNRIVAHESLAAALVEMEQIDIELALVNVKSRISALAERKPVRLWPRIAVAAAAVAAIVVGVYFFNSRHVILNSVQDPALAMNDIAPGKHGATITLDNGKVIQLSDAKSGVVVGSELKYNDGAAVQGGDSRVQTLTAATAKGQTYQVTLPDGTKVWLNADSKLEFASNFNNVKQRIVKLSGEGYFEVAKDKQHPFIVNSKGQYLIVLGTHFNVNSYDDEGSIKTTLLEGSVRVSGAGRNEVTLKPNEQSILSASQRIGVVQADVEQTMAWKNGIFIFDDENLESIMKKIARWYDVEIVYKDKPEPLRAFQGRITRNRNLSEVLKMVEFTGNVHFKIEGRKLIVTN